MALSTLIKKITLFLILFYMLAFSSLALSHVTSEFSSDLSVYDSDYMAYLTGAAIVKNGVASALYNLEFQNEVFNSLNPRHSTLGFRSFRNTPILALAFAPLLNLDLYTGFRLYTIINLVILGICVHVFSKQIKSRLWALLITLSFFPLIPQIYNGQLSIILGSVVLAILYAHNKKKHFLVGALTALLYIKPQYLTLFPLLLVFSEDKKRLSIGFFTALASFVALDTLLYGSNFLLNYLRFLSSTELLKLGTNPASVSSLGNLAYNLFGMDSLKFSLITTVMLLPEAMLLLFRNKQKLPPHLLITAAVLFTVALSPHTLIYDYLMTLPLIFVLLRDYFLTREHRYLILAATLYCAPLAITVGLYFLPPLLLLISSYYLVHQPCPQDYAFKKTNK